MTETLIQQGLGFLACIAVVMLTEPSINRMDRSAPLLLRVGLWLLCSGAAAAALFIALGDAPSWPAVIGAAGIALYLFSERRIAARQKWEACRRDNARPA